jgi:UDP-glucuronate 4-epimerase
MKVLVTGAAGFIGYHLATALLERGDSVIGVDSLNDYYDVRLKLSRLQRLQANPQFQFEQVDIADAPALSKVFVQHRPERVIHLAAQAGVRYSIINPSAYIQSNIVGFANILQDCRTTGVEHLVFASSSSVYGSNRKFPFSTRDNVDHPISLYAATKKADELMAHTYSHLFSLPATGLRFFSVYGPWGRPDMAPFLFLEAILEGRPINVFNHGDMQRDFTYVDDIVKGTIRVLDRIPTPQAAEDPDPSSSSTGPYKIYNIGNNHPVQLMRFIGILEGCAGRKAIKNFMPMQPGDVPITCADIDELMADTGFRPSTTMEEGLPRFVQWYRDYYQK